MKYNNKEEIKEKAIEMYLNGKKIMEIANETNCSRNFIGNLIRNDKRVQQYRNKKVEKLYKWKKQPRINVSIPVEYWLKIGISKDCEIHESVELVVDENNKTIVIRKH